MLTLLGLYLFVSIFLVAYVIIEEDADITSIKPALGRRILVLLFVPGGTMVMAMASLIEYIEGGDWKAPWVDLCMDLVEAWHGR